MTTQEVLQQSTVNGNIVKLPEVQLDRAIYMDVAKSLNLIGGKWKGGKVAGFVFNEDPTDLLSQIAGGEKRNIKKEVQFFGTPDKLADYVISLADIKKHHSFCEPEAGQGALVKAILRQIPDAIIDCYEILPLNQSFLKKIPNVSIKGSDFLNHNNNIFYDRIIANPPFSKNQDIDHVMEMYKWLKPGGRITSVASKHWQFSKNKKELSFKNWLNEINAEIIEVEAGEFKESGTSIATCIIIINK